MKANQVFTPKPALEESSAPADTANSDFNEDSALSDAGSQQQAQTMADRDTRIREAAYAKYIARNGAPGNADDDWYAAASEVDLSEGTSNTQH